MDEPEEDVTHWSEDDNPEYLAGEDAEDGNDVALKWAGVTWIPGPDGERVEVAHV